MARSEVQTIDIIPAVHLEHPEDRFDLHVELPDEGGEIRVFEEEREDVFGEAEVVEEMEAFAVDAPADQLVRRLVVHQRPQLGHESRNVR